METRKVEVSLSEAREWYNSNNKLLKSLALKAFNEEDLKQENLPEILSTLKKDSETHYILGLKDERSKILKYSVLRMIAKYFNKNWEKTYNNGGYYICKCNPQENPKNSYGLPDIKISYTTKTIANVVYFEYYTNAEKAVKILGKDVYDLF